MKELLRLAGWGTAATVALMLAVAIAYSPGGRQRLLTSISGPTNVQASAPAAPVPAIEPEQDARLIATETETRRLSDAVGALNADRERLLSRIASLERTLEDVTGSIKRQAAIAAQPPSVPPASTPPTIEPSPTTVAPPAPPPGTDSAPSAQRSVPEEPRVASVDPGTSVDEPGDSHPQPAFGVDVGGAVNFDGLRALWNSVRRSNAPMIEGLHPLVIARENPRTRAAELRLLIGPLPDPEAAAQFCATLTAAKRFCQQAAAFEGQELPLAASGSPRRPATAPKAPRGPVRPNP
jgi:hypothetical protein